MTTVLASAARSARQVLPPPSSAKVGCVEGALVRRCAPLVQGAAGAPPHDQARDGGYLHFDTLHELVRNATSTHATKPLFGTFAHGRFEWTTYAEFGRGVTLARQIMRDQLGVVPHSRVGIISNNRREWAIVAAAAHSLSAALVPMYEAQLPKDWSHILSDSGCASLFCSTEEIYLRAKREALPDAPLVRDVVCLDAPTHEPHSFLGAMARAERELFGGRRSGRREENGSIPAEDDAGIVAPSPDDLANLIYTSGTTGRPKGVELIHANQVSNIRGCRDMVLSPSDFPTSDDRSLAFLPWAHSYGQVR